MIERWFRFRGLKTELLYINEFRSPKQLRRAIRSYVDNYNALRPHQALDYATPERTFASNFAPSSATGLDITPPGCCT